MYEYILDGSFETKTFTNFKDAWKAWQKVKPRKGAGNKYYASLSRIDKKTGESWTYRYAGEWSPSIGHVRKAGWYMDMD